MLPVGESFTLLPVVAVRPMPREPPPPEPRKVPAAPQRPRFVTTVCAGRFLPPPPEVTARLPGLADLYPTPPSPPIPLYQYCSRPKAFTRRCHTRFNGFAGGDKRIIKGSTFVHAHPAGDASGPAPRLRKRKAFASRRPATPPPAPGRKHHPIQTEYYLEELFDKGVEIEVGVQTDAFADRPATPIYVPAKTGADAYTQIYPGDLFDFDIEVTSVVSALVTTCARAALAETARDEELCALRARRRRVRELRSAERAEARRLEMQEERAKNEAEAREAEAKIAAVAASEARARAAAGALVRAQITNLIPSVLSSLADQGYFLKQLTRGVQDEFMPWLIEDVAVEIDSYLTGRDLLTDIIKEVITSRSEAYHALADREVPEESSESDTESTISMNVQEEGDANAETE